MPGGSWVPRGTAGWPQEEIVETRRGLAAVLTLGVLATGCDGVTKQQLGTVLGGTAGAAGGVLGARALKGGTAGQVIGGLAGAGVGALIGNQIGKYLDDRDKQRLAKATVDTAETGRPQTVVSPESGTTIRTTPVASPPQQPAAKQAAAPSAPRSQTAQPAVQEPRTAQTPTPEAAQPQATQTAASSDRVCRTVRQTIVLKSGSQQEEDITVCKGPNGWEAVG